MLKYILTSCLQISTGHCFFFIFLYLFLFCLLFNWIKKRSNNNNHNSHIMIYTHSMPNSVKKKVTYIKEKRKRIPRVLQTKAISSKTGNTYNFNWMAAKAVMNKWNACLHYQSCRLNWILRWDIIYNLCDFFVVVVVVGFLSLFVIQIIKFRWCWIVDHKVRQFSCKNMRFV